MPDYPTIDVLLQGYGLNTDVGLAAFCSVVLVEVPANDGGKPRRILVDPAHVGHHDVHRDEVGAELLVLLHRLHASLRFANHLEAGLAEDVADHRPHEDRVVTYQNGVGQEASYESRTCFASE